MSDMIIQQTKDEVIIRLPKTTKTDDIQDMVDYFTYRMMTQNSKATQKDADELAKAAKKGRWERTRKRLGI
jgi:predicted RNA-binding protein (virulence factor B family)